MPERLEEARAFLRLYHREQGTAPAQAAVRQAEVARLLRRTGTYVHTPAELEFGARVAWRNSARCIGRLYWGSLIVRDRRSVSQPDDMARELVEHLLQATDERRVRSVITVFAPSSPGEEAACIESAQLFQYAGYASGGGAVLGDPQNIDATRSAQMLGWQPPVPRSRFDLLPICIREPGGRRLLYELPAQVAKQVEITHPDCPAIGGLGLRWYALPVVSNMVLTIGGIEYPCAPFNGFYMGTEIGSRNLGDENRYNLLGPVAEAIGLDTASDRSLWKDRALLELNAAVLHSYAKAGVTLIDHHGASAQFMEFVSRERNAGRTPSADWSWIVPPQASSSCPVFHLAMEDLHAVPNFYHSRAADGAHLAPYYGDEHRTKLQERATRWRRRLRHWWRARDGLIV